MNWLNVDLKSSEREALILDGLSFDTLLLEISCNIGDINKESIRVQFETDLNSAINSARELFNANIENILNDALEYRNNK